jgi:hypothetical protein
MQVTLPDPARSTDTQHPGGNRHPLSQESSRIEEAVQAWEQLLRLSHVEARARRELILARRAAVMVRSRSRLARASHVQRPGPRRVATRAAPHSHETEPRRSKIATCATC